MEEFDRIVVNLGLAHEKAVLERLRAEFDVYEARSEAATHELMRDKVPVIYQAQLSVGDLVGRPDFLIRHPSGAYQAADAKLKRTAEDKGLLIQLGVYQQLLGNGLPSKVFLGDGTVVELLDDSLAEADRFIAGIRSMLPLVSPPAARHAATKCSACPYNEICLPEFKAKGELTLLPDIDSRSAPGLEAAGIATIEQLAARDPETIPDVPYLKGTPKHRRAVL